MALSNPRALAVALGISPAVAMTLTSPSAIVDFAQQFQVDSSPSALGVVDFSQGFTVTGNPAPVSGSSLTLYGADLYQWLRGDTIAVSGSAVTSWTDRGPYGNHAVPGAAQPTYTAVDATCDNRPTVYSNGNSYLLSSALTTNLTTEDFYVAFIFKTVAWVNSATLSGGLSSNSPRITAITPSPSLRASSTSAANVNAGAPVGTWVRGEALWSTTPGASYLKLGNTLRQVDNPGAGTRTHSSLFALVTAGVGSIFWNGAMAEHICVKRPAGSGGPTGPERDAQDAIWLARYPSAVF
jgi:hypothetical protein